MALVSRAYYPEFPNLAIYWQWSTRTIDALGEKAACIFRMPKTGSITKIHWGTGSASGTLTISGGLQTVDDTTGFPTGTAYGGMAVGTYSNPDGSITGRSITLATPCAAVKGDVVSVVFEVTAYTSGSCTVLTSSSGGATQFPYIGHYTASWAKLSDPLAIALEYDDGTYDVPLGICPITSYGDIDYTNATATKEVGIYFQVPQKTRLLGIRVLHRNTTAVNVDWTLYDSANTDLGTISVDKDITSAPTASINAFLMFTTPIDLSANTDYYIGAKPAGNGHRMVKVGCFSASRLSAWLGTDKFYFVSRPTQGSGAWTTSPESTNPLALIIEPYAFTSGGLITHPGMAGGMRG